jgi:hypothetical protein
VHDLSLLDTGTRTCVPETSDSMILIMKSSKNRPWNDGIKALNRQMDWGVLVQRAMSPRFIIIVRVGPQEPA